MAKALDEGSLDKDPFVQEHRAKRMEELKQQASRGIQRYVLGGGWEREVGGGGVRHGEFRGMC